MVQVMLERDNVNDDLVAVRKLLKQNNDRVMKDEVVLEIETSKTIKEVCSPDQGILKIALAEGDEVAVNAVLFEVEPLAVTAAASPTAAAAADIAPPTPAVQAQAISTATPTKVSDTRSTELAGSREASRAAHALATALGVDLNQLRQGWITAADVRAASNVAHIKSSLPAATSPSATPSNKMRAAPKVPFRSVIASMSKRAESRNLSHANGNGNLSMIAIPIVPAAPRLVAPSFLFQDSITDLVIFEASRLLRLYPDLNAFRIDDRAIGFYEEVNFGISFDTGHKLKVLALRATDSLSLAQVQGGVEDLLHKYESDAPLDDDVLASSTVTLSDLSRSAVTFMLPLLNSEQSLILGITRAPAGGFVVHGSFDHRVSEGLQVARFLEDLRERVESHHRQAAGVSEPSPALSCSACDRSMREEIAAGRRGLLQMTFPDGRQGHVCRVCYEGW